MLNGKAVYIVAIALAAAFVLEVIGYIYMAATQVAIPEKFDTLSASTLVGLLGLLAKSPRE